MIRISARNVARALSLTAAVVATAAIAGASDLPVPGVRVFAPDGERIEVVRQADGHLLYRSAYAPDATLLARNEGTIAWTTDREPQESERPAERAEVRQSGWKDGTSSWPQPNRFASFLATAALVAFFFLRRLA